MRKLFAALFALVMLYAVVAVARSISSSPAETGAPYALECEITQPGVAEAEQCTCVHCSTLVANARFVETEIVRSHSTRVTRRVRFLANENGKCNSENALENAIASTVGTTLKLPMVAAVNSEGNVNKVRDARSADCVEVEVLGVGV